MAKREKRSIVDLMDHPSPEIDQLEGAVEKIHQLEPAAAKVEKEKTVRVTVDTPESLHKELKKAIIDESMDLKTFFLEAVREKYEKLKSKS